jgi:hypothetical protein
LAPKEAQPLESTSSAPQIPALSIQTTGAYKSVTGGANHRRIVEEGKEEEQTQGFQRNWRQRPVQGNRKLEREIDEVGVHPIEGDPIEGEVGNQEGKNDEYDEQGCAGQPPSPSLDPTFRLPAVIGIVDDDWEWINYPSDPVE